MAREIPKNDQMIQPAISIQIVLPEDTTPAKSSQELTVWHCGDEIPGHLEVVTCGDFEFEVIVSFEGIVRTWVGFENCSDPTHFPPTAEFEFLQETQKLHSDASTRSHKGNLCTHRLPFQFVVPHELISARSDVHSDFLKLCPSTKQGLELWEPSSRKAFRQPMIIYMIRIKRIRTDKIVENFMRSTYQREITIMPYAPAAPPLVIEAFPREYKSCVMKSLKQQSWRRSLGTLTLSASEPSPINILALNPRPSTTVSLTLVLTRNCPCDFDLRPCEWNCVVQHYLRIRTFYSTRRLDRMPTQAAAKADPFIRVYDQKTSSEVREYHKISWNKDNICHWTTNLKLPIRTTKNLLPTFLNQLSARQYAVVLRLNIQGISHGVIELVLPVQVICYPVPGTRLGIDHWERNEQVDGNFSSVSQLQQDFLTVDSDVSPPPYDL